MGNKIMNYETKGLRFSLIEDEIEGDKVYFSHVHCDKWCQSSPVYTDKEHVIEWMLGFETCHARMYVEQQLKPEHPYMGRIVK